MNINNFVIIILLALGISGCATTEYQRLPSNIPDTIKTPPIKKEGIYHKVERGQTLFRIAKVYRVDLEEIIAANNIPNAAAIEINQLLLIPGAREVKEIPIVKPATPTTSAAKESRLIDNNNDEFAWPLKGKVVGYFNDHKNDAVNKGIDIEGQSGDTVKVSREGKVVLSDYLGSWGSTVIIDHGDGFLSVYSQLASHPLKLGEHVYKGDPIAPLAQIGSKSILHFQIRKGQIAVNPLYYLP